MSSRFYWWIYEKAYRLMQWAQDKAITAGIVEHAERAKTNG